MFEKAGVVGGGGGVVTVVEGGRGYRGGFEDNSLPGLLGGSRLVEAVPQRMKVIIRAMPEPEVSSSSGGVVTSETAAAAAAVMEATS